MKILQRYVLQEIWMPFLLCFLTLNFIFMGGYLVQAASFIIGRGIPFLETLFVLVLALPDMISYTLPTSLLTAVLIVFGSLSQNNEIRAMKASGLHPFMVMIPAFLVGISLSFFMFVFNDNVTTNAGFLLRKVTKQIMIRHPMAMIEAGRFVKLGESIIFLTKEMDGNQMRDIVAYENENALQPVRTIMAERGEIVTTPDHTQFQIKLYDGSVSDSDNKSVQSIQFKTYYLPSFGQDDIRRMQKKMRDLSLAELLFKLPDVESDNRQQREIWSAFHQRIAFSLGCFVFVFIGIPTAIIVHRGEIILSFVIAMSGASLYYVLFVAARTMASEGFPPVIILWIPNLLLMGLGAYLLRKSFIC